MKVKKISCEQFAGLRNFEKEFTDGLNLIIGDNESGKSTLLNLISSTLHQNARINEKTDKAFQQIFFPAAILGKDGEGFRKDADNIDGKIQFSAQGEDYTLCKRWEKKGWMKLDTPDGNIIKEKVIEEKLSKILSYGSGIYNEIIFANQKNQYLSIKALLDGLSKDEAKSSSFQKERSDRLSQALMEMDGVSLKKLEDALLSKIKEYNGHWDDSADRPEKGANGRPRDTLENKWEKGVGFVLDTYYKMLEAEEAYKNAKIAEDNLSEVEQDHVNALKSQELTHTAEDRFQQFYNVIKTYQSNKDLLESLKGSQSDCQKAQEDWPKARNQLETAMTLRQELENIDCAAYQSNQREIAQLKQDLEQQCVSKKDVLDVTKAERNIDRLQAKLSGMNIEATLQTFGAYEAEIKMIRTGEVLNLENGHLSITDAVCIAIPGVMELQLAPKGVDITALQKRIADEENTRNSILKRCGAEDTEMLDSLENEYSKNKEKLEALYAKQEKLEKQYSKEVLEKRLPEMLRDEKDIQQDIRTLCPLGKSLDAFIGAKQNQVDSFAEKYTSMEELLKTIERNDKDIQSRQAELKGAEMIPDEFRGIDDPDEEMNQLRAAAQKADDDIIRQALLLGDAQGRVKSLPYTADELAEESERAKLAFVQAKETLHHWKHIYGEFQRLQEQGDNTSLGQLTEYFQENLSVLAGEQLGLNRLENSINADIVSGRYKMSFDILSEGTKDTIALAFRLAVVRYLFPDGDGLIVLDDPFTDMDPGRQEQACRLVAEFAKKYQVLFVTCDERYLSRFENPNVIRMK